MFNGGKQYHIFKLIDNQYINEFASDETKEAFENGTFYNKIDGSNGYYKDGVLYERYDDRKKKIIPDNLPEGIIELPAGINPSVYEDHHYYYKKMDKNIDSKKLKIIYEKLYDQVDGKKNGSVEFIGPNFQMTPGFSENIVQFHKELKIDPPNDRSFESIREFLLSRYEEGVIIEYKGRYWKIRGNVFDKNCLFEKLKKSWIKQQKKKELTNEEQKILELFNDSNN